MGFNALMEARHTTGVANEFRAASYFSKNGYDIYWPLGAQSRCDFVTERGGVFKKIQIKTATWSKTGDRKYLQCRLKSRNKLGKMYKDGDFDIIVFIDGNRFWITSWDVVKGLVSVCLDCDKEDYNPRMIKIYNPKDWYLGEIN